MKRKLLLLTAFAVSALTGMRAQTDVTSTYLTNADFSGEYTRFLDINTDRGVEKPKGWSVEWYQDNSDKNGMTYVAESMTQDNKTWNAKSGKAYFARMRWGNATLYLRQTLQNLRPGSYTLSFSSAVHSTGNGNAASVSVAGQTQTITAGTNVDGNWTDYEVSFTVSESTPYATIEIKAQRTAELLKVGFDEFKLMYDGSNYYETILSEAQKVLDDNKDWAENGLETFEQAINDNTGKSSIADKNTAIVALENAIQSFKEANSEDVTVKINNPNFDSNISGWTTTGGDGNNFQRQTSSQTNFTGGFLEKWRNGWTGAYNQKDFSVSQTLTGLPKGEYTVKAYILAQMQGGKETLGNDYKNKKHGGPYYIDNNHGVWMFATSGEKSSTTWANSNNPDFGETSGGVLRAASVQVENNELTIGFKGIGSPNGGTELGTYANWIACDTWTLSYFGFDPSTLQAQVTALKEEATALLSNSDYSQVVGVERTTLTTQSQVELKEKKSELLQEISEIQAAIDAFKAAKVNYDALVAEIVKAKALGIEAAAADAYAPTATMTSATALSNTQNLKVVEYNYVSTNYSYGVKLGEWKSEGTNTSAADFSNEHWSGETRTYKNQNDSNGQGWNANSWSINFNQDVTLPAGNYVFKVAGRQASDDRVVTSLIVKQGETTLGSVDDFPRSNSSRGINKEGATSFDENDAAGFANNGNGFGWEWRYVKFTLEEEATINIAVSAEATALHCWVSFGDYTLQTDNEANISLIAYNIALESAKTAIANTDYTNVVGAEKTTLQAKIDADETLDKTSKDAIDAATNALDEARTEFVNAKAAYDAYIAAKATEYADDKEYAAEDKFAAVTAAQNAGDATSKADAEAKTNAIVSAYRKYVESHAMAEGVEGAVDKTELIKDSNFAGVTIDGTKAGAWTFDQTGGSANINSNEPMTDGEGNSSYSYYDYYNGGNNNQNLHQDIENLEPGRYLLTVTARGHANFNNNLQLYVVGKGNVMIPAIGSTGGTFGRGWNDASVEFYQNETANITIGVKTDNGKNQWWGATRFRLVKLPAEPVSMSVKAGKYGTFIAPFDVAIPEGVKAYKVNKMEEDGITVKLEEVATTISANTPVVLENTTEENFTKDFFGKSTATKNTYTVGLLTGVYNNSAEEPYVIPASTEETVNYVLQTQPAGQAFYIVQSDYSMKTPNRAYLSVSAASGTEGAVKAIFFPGQGDATGINAVSTLLGGDVEGIYTVGGAKVNSLQKGVNIIRTADGKTTKVLVK